MSRQIEQALSNLIPRHPGSLPQELVELASSLLTQSRSKISNLRAEEEIGRTYACANIACERYITPCLLISSSLCSSANHGRTVLKLHSTSPRSSPALPAPPKSTKSYTATSTKSSSPLLPVDEPNHPRIQRQPSGYRRNMLLQKRRAWKASEAIGRQNEG